MNYLELYAHASSGAAWSFVIKSMSGFVLPVKATTFSIKIAEDLITLDCDLFLGWTKDNILTVSINEKSGIITQEGLLKTIGDIVTFQEEKITLAKCSLVLSGFRE